MRYRTRRRSLIALSSFAAYRKPGVRDDNGDGGNANPGGGGGTGAGQGGNTGGTGQQGGQAAGQQQGGNQGGQNGGQGEPQTVDQLPGWAQRVIADLRRENAAKRTSGNDSSQGQQNSSQQGSQNSTQQSQHNNDQAQRDTEIQAAQATARESVVQLAAYRSAGKHGADPDLLLDSRSFVEKLSNLDPSADDFSSKLAAAIKKAVEDNPKLRQVQAAGRSGGEFTGGPGGGAKQAVGTGVDRLRAVYAANQQT